MIYTMHINLGNLQQKVTEAEKVEPRGATKAFQSAFRHKKKLSVKGQMAKQLGAEKGKCGTETSPKSQALPRADSVPDSSPKPPAADGAGLSDGTHAEALKQVVIQMDESMSALVHALILHWYIIWINHHIYYYIHE